MEQEILFGVDFCIRFDYAGKQPKELTKNELERYAWFSNAVGSLCVEKRGGNSGDADIDRG